MNGARTQREKVDKKEDSGHKTERIQKNKNKDKNENKKNNDKSDKKQGQNSHLIINQQNVKDRP